MPRIARIVAEGLPHHITQRGNRRQKVFFSESDYQAYLDLLRKKPWDYKWSSARHHLGLEKSPVITGTLLKDMVDDWRAFLNTEVGSHEERLIQLHERTGRPLGEDSFVEKLEKTLNIKLKKDKPGPKPKGRHN